MTMIDMPCVIEASEAIKALAGTPPATSEKKMLADKEQDEAARMKRFLALPVRLQEGVLRYG